MCADLELASVVSQLEDLIMCFVAETASQPQSIAHAHSAAAAAESPNIVGALSAAASSVISSSQAWVRIIICYQSDNLC